ncbi:MAG: hypothetical protein CVV07_05895 [Gammaproteobacteria bacterium HGW-Gammaproteobacteria-11]|nr:MAG: hypothetical protein CVV07_05895 [Gammaproteobacteria bacterium HGW-Gammaproteobacteria-11]
MIMQSKNTVYIFMLIGMLAGVSNGIAKIILPLYAAHLGASATQIGLVGGLQFAGTLLLSLPIGALIGRFGSRVLFRFGGVSCAVVFLFALSLATSPWQLVAGVALLGTLNPFRMVTTQAEFLNFMQHADLRKAGWQRAAHSAGMFFLGPLLGGLMLLVFGFADTLRIVAAGLLLTVLIGDRIMSAAPAAEGVQPVRFVRRLLDQLQIVRSRADLRQTMLIEFVGQSAMAYFTVFVIFLGVREFGLSAQVAATLVSVQGGFFVFTLMTAGGVLSKLSEAQSYLVAFFFILCAQLILTGHYHYLLLWLSALLFGIGLGLQHITSVTRFALLTKAFGHGRMAGLFSLAGPAGGVTGAVLGGVLSDHLGLYAGFRLLVVLYAVMLIVHFARQRLINDEDITIAQEG